jgi:hypothetical protein
VETGPKASSRQHGQEEAKGRSSGEDRVGEDFLVGPDILTPAQEAVLTSLVNAVVGKAFVALPKTQ